MAPRSPTRPPPGRQALSRDFIVRHQRERILRAVADETARLGYGSLTVTDIVRGAGIARNTFYENYASKLDCFLVAQEEALEEAVRRVAAALDGVEGWEDRVAAGLRAFLAYLAEEPALARTCIVEAQAAGAEARAGWERSLARFAPMLRDGRAHAAAAESLPATLEDQLVGGAFWLLYQRIVLDEKGGVEGLAPELLAFILTPYVGAASAQKAVARL